MVVSESCPILGQQLKTGMKELALCPLSALGPIQEESWPNSEWIVIRWNNTRRIAPIFGTDEQY